MADGLEEKLGASGVLYRCACGAESEYQREAKLPPFWTLSYPTVGDRSYMRFACPACATRAPQEVQKEDNAEKRLAELRAKAGTTRRKTRKR